MRKLILHVDINLTVVVADAVQGQGPDKALNTFFASTAWGLNTVFNGNKDWISCAKYPSLDPPFPGATSFYKYLEGQLVRKSSAGERVRVKEQLGNFISSDYGHHFLPEYQKLVRALTWNHSPRRDDKWADPELVVRSLDGERYHYLLQSFIQLLYSLQDENRDFAVVFRTFGEDSEQVLRCVQAVTRGAHPDFKGNTLPLSVNLKPGHITRIKSNAADSMEFKLDLPPEVHDRDSASTEINTAKTSARDAYEIFSSLKGVCAIQDDYLYWRKNMFACSAGKPFLVDFEDSLNHHIFFDDNIRVKATDNIVDARILKSVTEQGFTSNIFAPSSISDMITLKDACLVQTNLLDSITNINYFVNKVKNCEENYSKLLGFL